MKPVVRFAPSPSGRLHVGNVRTALINWLYARHRGGRTILRFDDTAAGADVADRIADIETDLAWLGLDWDQKERQSARDTVHEAALSRLRAAGRLYPCYETAEELAAKRERQRARGRPPVYDRAALALSDDDRQALEADGRRPHWRFLLEPAAAEWTDLARGPVRVSAATFSDPVVVREDGTVLYALASVADDMDMGVTHVIRGDDHVPNTAVQMQMIAALGGEPPVFGHLPLIVDADGRPLSKRLAAAALGELRADGVEPMAVNVLLAGLGTGRPLAPCDSLTALAETLELAAFGRNPARFDLDQLRQLSARTLRAMPFEEVADRLRSLELSPVTSEFWDAVHDNLDRLDDAAQWHAVCFGTIAPVADDADLMATATATLPAEPWSEDAWGAWTKAVAAATGLRGRALYRPLRLALTGAEHGPELKKLLPIIGRERVLDRLNPPAPASPR